MNGKRRRLFFCGVGCACLALLIVGALSTPKSGIDRPGTVKLSRASGFYDAAFDLELSSDRGSIYYTLDSTDPDENAILYTGPIHIEDASRNENVYSMISDVSLDLNPDVLVYSGTVPAYNYKLPDLPVDKATVVKAICIGDDGRRGGVTTGVYFVDFDRKTGYRGVNVISITTDPKNLFDYDSGIYVLGRNFINSLKDGIYDLDVQPNYMFWNANYWQKGRGWERPAYVCCFDAERNLTLSGLYGIRIQGRGTRSMLPKSLNLFARKEYGAKTIPCLELLGADYNLESLNLNSGGNDMRTKLTDYLVNTLASDLDVGTREYAPYELFLDGEYWGLYWLTPKYKADYFQQKYEVYGKNVVEVKVDAIEEGDEEDLKLYEDMMAFICDNDMADPAQFEQACELIDLESCVDYYALQIYIANADWPVLNTALWRTRKPESDAYSDCKWRWLVFDVNGAMAYENARDDFVRWAVDRDPLFSSLMDNADFADAIYDRLVYLAENNFYPGRVGAFVEDYALSMVDAIENEYNRFYNGERTAEDFLKRCDMLKSFFERRYDYIMNAYGERHE